MDTLPDVIVLGAGGRQGDAWLTGLLAGIEDGSRLRLDRCDYFVGTSAGAIAAARLAAGVRLRRPTQAPVTGATGEQSPVPNRIASSATALAAPLAHLGLRIATRPGELLRAGALRMVPSTSTDALDFGDEFSGQNARFDGRLRIVAVERRSGRRVVFGSPGAPNATVTQAVTASCSVPTVFEPTVVDGIEYVDGALWSPSNADAAPARRGAHVLLVCPMAGSHGPFNPAMRALCRAAARIETSALIARGVTVQTIAPDRNSASSIGSDLMRNTGQEQTLAAGYLQGLSY